MAKVTVSFSLDDREDRDIIRYLNSLARGEKSAAIRDALRAKIGGQGVTLADVYQITRAIERKLDNGVTVSGTGSSTASDAPKDEDPELAANLDSLLGM
jgi:hypothetical protein